MGFYFDVFEVCDKVPEEKKLGLHLAEQDECLAHLGSHPRKILSNLEKESLQIRICFTDLSDVKYLGKFIQEAKEFILKSSWEPEDTKRML